MRIWEFVSIAAMFGVVALAAYLLRTAPPIAADFHAAVRRPRTWLVGVPAFLLVIGLVIPYVDAHVFAAPTPKPLSFADLSPGPVETSTGSALAKAPPTTSTTVPAVTTPTTAVRGRVAALSQPGSGGSVASSATASDPVAGSWVVGSGTEARYGIDDTVMGQTSHVVGRTHDVTGAAQIVGYSVTSAKVVVNMQTVTCQCVHDSKYHQMLETSKYPTSMFVLTSPISLGSVPQPGVVASFPVAGNFTIHGVTRTVTFIVRATRIGARLAVMATIPVKLSDYNIQAPSGGSMGGLSNCTIDFLIVFDRTS